MLKRLYAHNFRCLENFELTIDKMPSILLIGKNGVGKTTIGEVLRRFQQIGRGVNRIKELIEPDDFSYGRSNLPIRLELEAILDGGSYHYSLALELPEKFRELKVAEEKLSVEEKLIYSRKEAQITLFSTQNNREAQFLLDWHLIALPIIQEQSPNDPLRIFRNWLANMIVLNPIPSCMDGNSGNDTLAPRLDGTNIGEWFSGLLSRYPAAYADIDQYLRNVMPDISDVQNEVIGKNSRSMKISFEKDSAYFSVDFKRLSDGEKCFFLCALVLAANRRYGPIFCFWDEPDNYLSLSDIGHFIVSLRRSFQRGGQILLTSHNAEVVRKFSDENTFILGRSSHLEPTLIRLLCDISHKGNLINSLITGDLEP
ncbi:ATPase_AAA_core domain-containing protein [Gammaproteobacteria bacterium]